MIHFTSDTHFNHENVIKYSQRPFSSLGEMTQALIDRWNSVVKRGDVVYHLGDFALSWGKKHYSVIDLILSRLNGSKFLICGNHDRDEVKKNPRWSKVCDYHELTVSSQKIVLCHYSMRTWNKMHYGSWMLHGHSHGNLPDNGGKTMDVGVDVHDFTPVSFDFVGDYMSCREIFTEDHHTPLD